MSNTLQFQYNNQKNLDFNSGGDLITQLPADTTQPSQHEIQIVNTLFKTHNTEINNVVTEFKDAILVGLLFLLLSSSFVDNLIIRFIPSTSTSVYMLLGIKTLLIILIFWLLKHYYLSRKQTK
jgi:hypothetical protein|uniref:Uncharacterized protein n=1 Tax=viral metagenome TaxID=1070528 RepID=A0A6C0CXN5_9ZZZZ